MKKILILLALFLITACVRSPQPISLFETEEKAFKDISNIEEIKKNNKAWEENLEIDLYTAIALAIKNNKELKIKLLENALANRQIDKIKFEMLPSLAANAGYSGSDKYRTTTSANVSNADTAGVMGTTYTTSSEKGVANQDIGFTWNALDFGLSYIKAGQSNNRYLISDEAEKKASHNIVREVIRTYWNSLSAEKLIKKYDPLLIKVDLALNDSQKIEELLLTKPMDALLYQKELLDIQRALQTQKQIFIDAKIQLGTLMGLLPNQKFKIVDTNEPLTILDMSLKGMEEHALIHRPELIENHYEERISVQQAKAGIVSLLPGLNFNAAWTSSSNDYLMNKTNFEYGSTLGANLLNVFSYPKIKEINETNLRIIKEQRLALSMAVLSQVHLSNINYQMALEEYATADRYYDVSQKITAQVKNAQKIAKFGNLELIREEASLLVAELRYDIAYTKLQHAIGQIYTSVGLDVTEDNVKGYDTAYGQIYNSIGSDVTEDNVKELGFKQYNVKELGVKQYAKIIKNNFKSNGKRYYASVQTPINKQNPVIKKNEGKNSSQFTFKNNTFKLDGFGNTNYEAYLVNGDELPFWITFLPSQRTFIINELDKNEIESLDIKVTAKNIHNRINNTFTLLISPEMRTARLAKEKEVAKQIKIAKKLKEKKLPKKTKLVKKNNKKIKNLNKEYTKRDKNEYFYRNELNDQRKNKLVIILENQDIEFNKLKKITDEKKAEEDKKLVALQEKLNKKYLEKSNKLKSKKLIKLKKEQDKKLAKLKRKIDLTKTKEDLKLAKLKQKQISEFNEAQKTVKAEQIVEDKRINKINQNELKKLAEVTKKNQKKLAEKLTKENKIAAAKKAQEDKIIARKVRAAEDKRIKEYLKMLKEKEKEAKKLEKKLKKEAKKEAKKKKTRS
ncbi:TolC family protein [Candidatus Pelagibacter sp. Uisw_116]|uniref:TolC family protein n=1 Tax=Candidatus Pelagibacter sp. Uisw_116 TaxID=3230986 RepID=UPI0039E94162